MSQTKYIVVNTLTNKVRTTAGRWAKTKSTTTLPHLYDKQSIAVSISKGNPSLAAYKIEVTKVS